MSACLYRATPIRSSTADSRASVRPLRRPSTSAARASDRVAAEGRAPLFRGDSVDAMGRHDQRDAGYRLSRR